MPVAPKKPARKKTAPKRPKTPGSGRKLEPRYEWPDIVSADDMAALLGVTRRYVLELANENRLVRVDGKYRLLPSIKLYGDHLRDKAAGRAERDGGSTLATEKAGLTRAQRESEELKLAAARRLVIPIGEVREGWTKFAVKVRSTLLSLPSKIRATVPHMNAKDAELVAKACRRALDEIADDLVGDVPPPGAAPEGADLRDGGDANPA